MNFYKKLAHKLGFILLVFIEAGIFVLIFYPETLDVFKGMGHAISIFKFWPFVIALIVIRALPSRKR